MRKPFILTAAVITAAVLGAAGIAQADEPLPTPAPTATDTPAPAATDAPAPAPIALPAATAASATEFISSYTTNADDPYRTPVTVGSYELFDASDGTTDTLWRTTGSVSGTKQVPLPTTLSAVRTPRGLTVMKGWAYFYATTDDTDYNLYRSNGSTVQAVTSTQAINSVSATFCKPVAIGSTLYFAGQDGADGAELWRTDGTASGTKRVADIIPGSGSSGPCNFGAVGSTLYFAASDGTHGRELWRSQGTAATTWQVADINPGSGDSVPANITSFQGAAYFSATDGTHGIELWASSDGQHASMVNDLVPGSDSSSPTNLTASGSYLLFSSQWGADARLTRTDGTDSNTQRNLVDGYLTGNIVKVGSYAYYGDSEHTDLLMRTKGGLGSATEVKDFGTTYAAPQNFLGTSSRVFFDMTLTGSGHHELWESNGSSSGTKVLTATATLTNDALSPIFAMSGHIFYVTADGHLWATFY